MKFKLTFIILYLLTFSLFSESIILDDGRILKREIISMDVNTILCKTPEGVEEKISRDRVIRVVYKEINKEDLQELLTEAEKKKIEDRKEAKAKELEKLKIQKEEENKRKEELAEKRKQEEEKLKKSKKDDIIKSVSEKNEEIDRLSEREREKDRKIIKLEEKISKLEEEIKETNSVLENTRKDSSEANSELISTKKELTKTKEELDFLKKKTANQKDETLWAILGRSAIAPGWGHFYMNQNSTGYLYSGLFWTSFIVTFYHYDKLNASKKHYDNSIIIPTQDGLALSFVLANERLNIYTENQQSYNKAFSVLSFIYLVQLTHAYISGKKFSNNSNFGFRTYDSAINSGDRISNNRNYEMYFQFQF